MLNKIRALLFTAKLNIKFWAEALEAAVFIYNKTLYSTLNFKLFYEIKNNKIPEIKNIKIWGSICYNKVYNI